MKKYLFTKRSFVAISLFGIFIFTGFIYVHKTSKVFGFEQMSAEKSDETNTRQSTEKSETMPTQSSEGAQSADAQLPKEDRAHDPVAPSESLVDVIVSAVKSVMNDTTPKTPIDSTEHVLHTNITTTFFWIGEEADKDNKNISNVPSAWDEEWSKHYGGVDSPKKRSGYNPSEFTPKENPFYFALPYNDFNAKGKRKKNVLALVPWAHQTEWKKDESVLKNQWIKIIKDDKTAYAQWEDVGPFEEDDSEYVFGTESPKSKTNKHAGLDVSPAVHDYLDLSDMSKVDWQFVNVDEVPDGPWKDVVTTSQINWK
jgi:hypothetical protein